jgi:hypothetical protein
MVLRKESRIAMWIVSRINYYKQCYMENIFSFVNILLCNDTTQEEED